MYKDDSQRAYALTVGTTSTNYAVVDQRDPTPNDVYYPIGKFWINNAVKKLWYLNSQTNASGQLQSIWELISVESMLISISDDANTPVFPTSDFAVPNPDNIQLVGINGVTVTAVPASNLLQISGPGSVIESLTPDVGAPVTPIGDTIPVLGYPANTVPTVTTYNDGSDNFRIEDRTWQSQYVVDPSNTPGLQGTFTTITAAIAQVVADGTGTNPRQATIFVRSGTYTEDINIPSLTLLNIVAVGADTGEQTINSVVIDGTLTNSANSVFWFSNIRFQNSGGGDALTLNGSTAQTSYFINCAVISDVTATNGSYVFVDGIVNNMTFSGAASFTLQNCINLSSPTFTMSDNSSAVIIDSGNVNTAAQFILSDNASFYTNNFRGLNGATGTTATPCEAYNTIVSGTININGTFIYSNISGEPTVALISDTVNSQLMPTTCGNVIQAIRVDDDYQVLKTDFYIGVVTRASPITLTLPDTSDANASPILNQTFIVNDEAGIASTQSITIQPTGGLINGAANFVIETDNACITIIFDGTNYFTSTSGIPSFLPEPGANGNLLTSNGTNWISAPPASFSQINVQTFIANGTYTPTSGMKWCCIECVGGGGGGGGAAGAAALTNAGGGGGGGAYVRTFFNAATIGASKSVTVGAAGTGGANTGTGGSNGGSTSVGALITAPGGMGGNGTAGAGLANGTANGGVGASAGYIAGSFTSAGAAGGSAIWVSGTFSIAGYGGASGLGAGNTPPSLTSGTGGSDTGDNASVFGAGGGGSTVTANVTGLAGGSGQQGIVVVTEYI